MARSTLGCLLGLSACWAGSVGARLPVAPVQAYDVVVYGATPGGIAAAVGAANASTGGVRVALVSPDPFIGGMMTAGGIGLRDIGNLSTVGPNSIAMQWALLNAEVLGVSYPVWQPGNAIGNASLWKILGQFADSIDVFLNQPLIEGPGSVNKSATTLTAIATGSSWSTATWWSAQVFMDATYDGDLVVASGCSWTYGRESRATYNESYAGVQPFTTFGQFTVDVDPFFPNGSVIPFVSSEPLAPEGSGDTKMMAYSYRACITTNTSNQVPFPQPADYDPSRFELLQRLLDGLSANNTKPGPAFSYLVGAYPYRSFPGSKTDLCDSNNAAVTSDAVNLNVGYVNGSYADRARIRELVKGYVQGYVYYLANDPRVPPATRASVRAYGLCADEWPENGNWPTQMYIREGVRLVGERVTTQNDNVGGVCHNDSIGLASWADDIHVVQRVIVPRTDGPGYVARNEGEMMAPIDGVGPYTMSYDLLLPKRTEATNLLAPVPNSISHAAIGGLREEPEYLQLGTAAGIAAALAIEQRVAVQDVSLPLLQAGIIAQGGLIQPAQCKWE